MGVNTLPGENDVTLILFILTLPTPCVCAKAIGDSMRAKRSENSRTTTKTTTEELKHKTTTSTYCEQPSKSKQPKHSSAN